MSARTVPGVISGQVKQGDFIRDDQSFVNALGRMLGDGRLLSDVRIAHVLEWDDDWIEFHFSERDPAVGPFRRVSTE
jgi:hypothetical protein